MRYLLAFAAVGFLMPLLRADEEKLPLDKLPKAVKASVDKHFAGAKLKEAAVEKEDGKTVYEVSFTYKDANYDVTFEEDGKIVDVEKEIAVKDLPAAITEALEAKYPKAKIDKAEELAKADLKPVAYELLVTTADKKKVEIKFDTAGKIVKEEKKDK